MEAIYKTEEQLREFIEQANELVNSGNSREKAEGRGMLTVICFMQNNLKSISNEYLKEVKKHSRCYI